MNATCSIPSRSVISRHALTQLAILLAWALLALQSSVAMAAAPAGTPIGNQASATYVDNTGTTRNTSSNTVVTTVAQVKTFTLLQSGAKTVPANQQVCYPHSIVNTGNGADTYALNAPTQSGAVVLTSVAYFADANADGLPDNVTAITSSGALASGGTYNFVVCGTTPAGATPGQTGTLTVLAQDTSGAAAQSQNDVTTIGAASVSVTKKLSSVAPPGYTPVASGGSPNNGLYVIFDYTNSGSIQATNLQITDILPKEWQYVAASGRWSASGATALSDTNTANPAGISYTGTAPNATTGGTVTTTVATVNSGSSGQVYFQVNLVSSTIGSFTNTAQYQYSYFYNAATVNVPSSNTNSVPYQVLQTADVAANGTTTLGKTDGEPVTINSAAPGQTISFTDYVWNRGNAPDGFDITVLNSASCSTVATATNACTFPAGTTFQILASSGATTLLNTGGTSDPDTGSIPLPDASGACPAPYIVSTGLYNGAKKCGYAVVVTATIPVGATPATPASGYQVTLNAQSFFNTAVSDTVPNRLNTIAANTVDLTNTVSVATATAGDGLGATGATVIRTNSIAPSSSPTTTIFPIYVNNTGATAAIYDLTYAFSAVPAAGGIANPPAGWNVTFKASGSGVCATTTGSAFTTTGAVPIPAGGNQLVCAEVVVPAISSGSSPATPTYAAPGDYDLLFRAQQQGTSGPGAVFDTITDRVTVQQVHRMDLTPNGAQSTVPGGSVTYSHTLTNNGNVPETITFPAATTLTNNQTPTYSWNASANLDSSGGTLISAGGPITSVTLQPNSSRTIVVTVSAPASAGSPPNTTALTIAYNGGASSTQATDVTTLSAGLKLDKYQQLVPTCAGGTPSATLPGSWTSTAIPAGPNTIPGKCIAYLIVGTNTTASNITSINISDLVPSNTILETGCGAPSATAPLAVAGGPYANGFTGTVQAQSGAAPALLPAGTASLQFCVKIN